MARKAEAQQRFLSDEADGARDTARIRLHQHRLIEAALLADERIEQIARRRIDQAHEWQPIEHILHAIQHAARQEALRDETEQRDQHHRHQETDARDGDTQPPVDRGEDANADVDRYREGSEKDDPLQEVIEKSSHGIKL